MNKEINFLQEILDYQEKIFNFMRKKNFFIEEEPSEERLLKLISGLAIISSIYEKFTIRIVKIYCEIANKTENETRCIINNTKSMAKISKLIEELCLDVEETYKLLKLSNEDILDDILKSSYINLINHMNKVYKKRNSYVHGEFKINENIKKEKFEEYILDTFKLEMILLRVLKNAFISKVPDYLLEREEKNGKYKRYKELSDKFLSNIDSKFKKEKSQFFTPLEIAQKMVEDLKQLNIKVNKEGTVKILDPSCGLGILTIVLIEKIFSISNDKIYRIEIDMIDDDVNCIEKCKEIMEDFIAKNDNRKIDIRINYINANYLDYEIDKKYDFIVQNPPFKKVTKNNKSKYNRELLDYINGQANLYHFFIIKSLKLLDKNGILFTISPKNFLSGKYTEKLRNFLFSDYSLTRLHIFDERKSIFNNIIQEICITKIENRKHQNVKISYNGNSPFETKRENLFLNKETNIILTPRNKEENDFIEKFKKNTEQNNIFSFHPGKVVQFRVKEEFLSSEYYNKKAEMIPLIVPKHLKNNKLEYGKLNKKLHNSISILNNEKTKNLFLKNSKYIILMKNAGKEEDKLIKVAVYDNFFDSEYIALDNNLAYIKFLNENIENEIFYGVYCILNSKQFDAYYRMINGSHTINSYEFENLLFPKQNILKKIGLEYLKLKDNSIEKCSEIFDLYL